MNFLENIKNLVVGMTLALVIGIAVGYHLRGEFTKANTVDAVTKAQHGTATGIEQSLTQSHAVESKVTASNAQADEIRTQVAARLQKEEHHDNHHAARPPVPAASAPAVEPGPQVDFGDTCRWSLDSGIVGLLDDARAGTAPDPTGGSNGESQAAPAVEEAEFIDNDLQIVKLYHELAARHDALVDYVEALLKKQAK